jgi:mannose-6-phosphate isomerase
MLYPLKFSPILKDKIWGGTKLKSTLNKASDSKELGESWELSGIENDESVVENGFLAGNNLTELIEVYMGDLVGDKIYDAYGLSFPLLFKFIDANQNLSIQVHPNDETAMERHSCFGKTEMWYVVDADKDAELIIGFTEDCSKESYLEALENDTVEDLLQHIPIAKGDVFFIPAGLVHAICKGALIAEIQQSSDITYRIYDYKRVDDKGNERELHTEQALDVIDFSASKNPKTIYKVVDNQITELVNCDYFTTNLIAFDAPLTRNYGTIDSFVAYMCLEGSFVIETESDKTVVNKGETVLIPACINELGLIPDEKTTMLEVFVLS